MEEGNVKNVDYVASRSDSVDWLFTIDPATIEGDIFVDKLLFITQALFNIFDGFVVPTEVTYTAGTKPVGATDWRVIRDKGDTERYSLRSKDGVTYANLEHNVRTRVVPDGQELYASYVEFTDSRTRVYLRNDDVWIDTTSEEWYKGYSRGNIGETPSKPLLSISVAHIHKSYSEVAKTDDSMNSIYYLTVGSCSDIWLGDSPVERVNRARLGRALKQILDYFEVIETTYLSDFAEYIDEDVAAVVFDEKQNEDELIETAREWLAE